VAADRILVDTSVIIEFFRKKKKDETVLHGLLTSSSVLHISIVTYFELLCGAKSEALLDDTIKLLELFEVINLSEPEAKNAANIFQGLKKNNAMIGLADIFIAATAIAHDLPLATLNRTHFERIAALQIIA
jgi:predicted nucleic acid-binding protein